MWYPSIIMTLTKIKTVRKFRRRSPEQHAAFLQHISARNDLFELRDGGVIEEFDPFYSCALELLERFYPERSVTVSNRDPYYVTPQIKHMLREKNRLMRTRNIDAANALALQIGKAIARRDSTQFVKINHVTDPSQFWKAVTSFKKQLQVQDNCGLSAEKLNNHYAVVSIDKQYKPIDRKQGPVQLSDNPFTEFQVFKLLDTLKITATGLDNLPAWFLRLGAPCFAGHFTKLFNMSLQESTVPLQWKNSVIKPIPKIKNPSCWERFSANINHSSSVACDGETGGEELHLSSNFGPTRSTHFRWPICLQADWINDCRHDLPLRANYRTPPG